MFCNVVLPGRTLRHGSWGDREEGLSRAVKRIFAVDVLRGKKSPVGLVTSGIGNGRRVGRIVISVNGFVPQILEKKIEDAIWALELRGDKFGINLVKFDSREACFGAQAVSGKCIEQSSRIDATLQTQEITSDLVCSFGPGAAYSEVRRVSVRGKPYAYLHMLRHGGSGGSGLDISLILNPDASRSVLENNSAVCGVLF